jgi:vacuolar-type H+-ATPase catalytic subunit A/Vma1
MTEPIPSGFKTREEYNDYMKKYNRGYRTRRKAERELLVENIKKILAEKDEMQTVSTCVEAEVQKLKDMNKLIRDFTEKLKSTEVISPSLLKNYYDLNTNYLDLTNRVFDKMLIQILDFTGRNCVETEFFIHMLLILDKEGKKETTKLDSKPS